MASIAAFQEVDPGSIFVVVVVLNYVNFYRDLKAEVIPLSFMLLSDS